jgi:DNA-binding MarR family transcriptional regulator
VPNADPLASLLLDVVRALDPMNEQALSVAKGATLSQLAALRLLGTRRLSVSALAAELGTHRSSASRMVDRLVAAGLAEKRPSATSGREVEVAATAQGRATAKAVSRYRQATLSRLLADLPQDQRGPVTKALTTLLQQLRSAEG